jgi:pimeloyl-ACP methyl ester carboxylesterase
MKRVAIEGASIDYSETGMGQPLVLVHGSASDQRTWQHQRNEFAKNYRVISYSRRYHWPNAPIADGTDYAMQQQVEDLGAILRSLDAAPAHLVGHSYGGFLCLLLALRNPALVRTLVLAEPPVITLFVSNVPTPAQILKLLVTRPRTAAAIIKLGATGIGPATKAFQRGEVEAGARAFGDAIFGKGAYDHFPPLRKEQVRDNLLNMKAEFLGSGFVPLRDEDVRSLKIPTLLLTGERSLAVFHRLTDRLAELLPQATRLEIPGASHAVHEDNAVAFNSAVSAFLAKHRPLA